VPKYEAGPAAAVPADPTRDRTTDRVDPRNATAYSAINRPRIVGSVVSWTVVLPTARNDTLAAPDLPVG